MRIPMTWIVRTAVLFTFTFLLSVDALAAPDTVTVHVAGYTYSPFVTTSLASASDLDLDASGNLYFCKGGDIRRISPQGIEAPWSLAPAVDLVFTSSGTAYGVGTACQCVLSIAGDGSATTLHADSSQWRWTAHSGSGTLYASTIGLLGARLYTVDPQTGTPTLIINGGPGPAGSGIYEGLLVGLDGKLYANGTDGSPSGWGVFRLDGDQFVKVGSFPNGGFELAQDNQSLFYTVTTVERFNGPGHEVWQTDPNTGLSTLLADGPHPASCVAFDRQSDRLYVGDNLGTIYIIEKGPTPTRRETWGAVKSKYR